MVNVACTVAPLYVAEMVATTLTLSVEVVMVNDGDTDAPALTVTEVGTLAATLLLCSVTMAPPVGAGPVSLTLLAVVDPPPTTEAGDKVIELMLGSV